MSALIRVATRQEMAIILDGAAAEGWNPGRHDAACFHAADPTGFLIGWLGDEPIATISVVKYAHACAFLGFYRVTPKYRGQGYGRQIWNAGIDSLGQRSIGLDGVVAQQDNYRKSGFSLAYKNVRYRGLSKPKGLADSQVVPLSAIDFDLLAAYDRQFVPAPRDRFLRCWIAQPQSTLVGILENRQLVGYGVIRACLSGFKIGPLFADTAELAQRLFTALQMHVAAGSEFFIDIPEVNQAALEMVIRQRMDAVLATARMYSGERPDLPMNRIFGVTTFELG